uniref:Reverse transcriptase domain-containing protein n=1 Tax=Schistocephalus solidus TaxID=70667 RepID=A0A183TFG2_SCHSO
LNGGKVFARIDLSEAYLQLLVDEAAQEMLTINTHKAPNIFQQLMDTMLTNVPGTVADLDEILVVGRTDEERLQRLDKVMENLIDYGLKINFEKNEFLRKKIHYLGRSPSEGFGRKNFALNACRQNTQKGRKKLQSNRKRGTGDHLCSTEISSTFPILLSYDFTIQYVPTQKFGAPDALSRLSVSDENQEDVVIASTLIRDDEEFRGVIRQVPLKAEHIRATTTADPLLQSTKSTTRAMAGGDETVD